MQKQIYLNNNLSAVVIPRRLDVLDSRLCTYSLSIVSPCVFHFSLLISYHLCVVLSLCAPKYGISIGMHWNEREESVRSSGSRCWNYRCSWAVRRNTHEDMKIMKKNMKNWKDEKIIGEDSAALNLGQILIIFTIFSIKKTEFTSFPRFRVIQETSYIATKHLRSLLPTIMQETE